MARRLVNNHTNTARLPTLVLCLMVLVISVPEYPPMTRYVRFRRHLRNPMQDGPMGMRASVRNPVSRRTQVYLPKAMAVLQARRRKGISPCLGREKQLLQVRSGHLLQSSPFTNGKEHGRFHAAFGHNLWSIRQAGFKELAESCLGLLDLPYPCLILPPTTPVQTRYKTSLPVQDCQGGF